MFGNVLNNVLGVGYIVISRNKGNEKPVHFVNNSSLGMPIAACLTFNMNRMVDDPQVQRKLQLQLEGQKMTWNTLLNSPKFRLSPPA